MQGIHTAGDADDTVVKMCVLHALHQAGNLDVEHALAVFGKRLLALGQMRVFGIAAGKDGIGQLAAPELNAERFSGKVKAARRAAQIRQMLHVDLAHSQTVVPLALRKKRAVFGDEAKTGIAVVGRALAPAGGGEQQ